MSTVNHIRPASECDSVELPFSTSLMAAAVDAGLGGVAAECGGTLSCADDMLTARFPNKQL